MNQSIASLIPQQEDGIRQLLARLRGSPERGTLLASASRTVSTSSSDIATANRRALYLWINVSAVSGTGGLTPYIMTQDPVTGVWGLNWGASATITTVRTTVLKLGDGVSVGSGLSPTTGQADRGIVLPTSLRLYIAASDASAYTYSVGYELI